jgi:glycosyltransferase involved in cell wall biosynthesis
MLNILSVAYPFARVERDAVGGAEQVLAAIDAALSAGGHQSTLLAAQGSRSAGKLVSVDVGEGDLCEERLEGARAAYRHTLQRLVTEHQYDLVHFHGCDCAAYLCAGELPQRLPKLVTLHVPYEWYDPCLFRPHLGLAFNCVSRWQEGALAPLLPVRTTIENGVDLERWRPLDGASDEYVLCLGRISPEKGFERALRAAQRADVPLVLAGQVFAYPEHQRHFAREIVPLLDGRRRFVGAVGGEAKRRLLASARCLVVASHVAETSSLVVMEALACGTPVVVASPGAPASLIENGVTGLLAGDDGELADALQRVRALDRRACRSQAEQRFDVRQTTQRYLDLYRELSAAPIVPDDRLGRPERAVLELPP